MVLICITQLINDVEYLGVFYRNICSSCFLFLIWITCFLETEVSSWHVLGSQTLISLSNILCPSTYYLLFWLFLLVCTSILVRNYHACLFFTRLPVFQVHSPNTVSELISNSFCPAILYNKFIVLHLSIGLFNVFCNGFYTWCEIGVKIHSYACWWFSQDVLKIPSFHWSAF